MEEGGGGCRWRMEGWLVPFQMDTLSLTFLLPKRESSHHGVFSLLQNHKTLSELSISFACLDPWTPAFFLGPGCPRWRTSRLHVPTGPLAGGHLASVSLRVPSTV